MKKNILGLLVLTLCLACTPALAQETATVYVNGTALVTDQPAIIVDDRTLVPLRAIFEALGAKVDWIQETETVLAQKRTTTISLQIESNRLYVNGVGVEIDVPAQLVNDRTLVPVRAISEALGASVLWDQETSTVTIVGAQGDHAVTDKYLTYKEQMIDADGTAIDLLSISCAYPELANPDNNPVIAQLNTMFASSANQFMEDSKATYLQAAKNEYAASLQNGFLFVPYTISRTFDIPYDKNGILSIFWEDYRYAGGISPEIGRLSVTYDMGNGQALDLAALASLTPHDITGLYTLAAQQFASQTQSALPDMQTAGYYLSDAGIVFYLNPAQVTPQPEGVLETTIAY